MLQDKLFETRICFTWCVHTLEYYSAIKKNEIMPFAAIWVDLKIIILSEINQTEKGQEWKRQISYDIGCMWNLKYVTNEHIYKTETDPWHRKPTYGYQGGKVERGQLGLWD